MIFSEEFSYQEWKKLNLPKEILDYIKFYDTTWKKKIPNWYSSMPETGTSWEVIEFKEIFPMPIDTKTAKEWLDDSQDLFFLTVNDAGDDGWDTTDYGYETSFKKFIYNNVDRFLKENVLTETQIKLAQEFKRNIK